MLTGQMSTRPIFFCNINYLESLSVIAFRIILDPRLKSFPLAPSAATPRSWLRPRHRSTWTRRRECGTRWRRWRSRATRSRSTSASTTAPAPQTPARATACRGGPPSDTPVSSCNPANNFSTCHATPCPPWPSREHPAH